jgi:hypothetical protein
MIAFKRSKIILLAAMWLLAACQIVEMADPSPGTEAASPANSSSSLTATSPPTPAPATPTPSPIPATPTASPAPTKTNVPVDLAISAEDIQLYPVPFIVSGDRITFQVQPQVPNEINVSDVQVDIFVNDQLISTGMLDSRNWAGQAEGIYEWVWDTQGHFGDHQVRIVLDGDDLIQTGDSITENNEAVLTVDVRKVGYRPLEERDAIWVTTETDCCLVKVLTRTTAYRDLPELADAVEQAVSQAAITLQEEPQQKINVFFIEKTVGQGGFAGSEMAVTYNDRSYAGGNLHELLVHEAVHVLDRQFAPQRIKLLAEGTAVWASGGHYKPENLDQRAAALLQLGRYIPLPTLADDFYPSQHEIGYLQAGAFVKYLVDQFGYPTYRDFYTDTTASDGATEAESLDLNLQTYYDASLAELEAEWLSYLESLPRNETEVADLETTIRYYEVMRRYQQQYDPAAYFLTAWLPNLLDIEQEGNTADLTRHPQKEINITLEVMLKNAEAALIEQELVRANVILDSIERILNENGAFADPLSSSFLDIVQKATAFGYEVQDIDLQGDLATVLATTASGVRLTELDFERRRGDWILVSN